MKKGSKIPRYSTEKYIEFCKQVHNNKYTYEKCIYTGSKGKVIITCPKHGDFEQYADAHKSGKGCPKCANERKGQSKLDTVQFIKLAKAIHGDKYDYSKINYVSTLEHIEIICPIHGSFLQRPNNHLCGRGCPKCGLEFCTNNLNSDTEYELYNYIKSIYSGKIIKLCRNIITPQELDIFLPDLNIAIEYDGLYWHSDAVGKDKNYHLDKTNQCLEKGIKLIHIFEDE